MELKPSDREKRKNIIAILVFFGGFASSLIASTLIPSWRVIWNPQQGQSPTLVELAFPICAAFVYAAMGFTISREITRSHFRADKNGITVVSGFRSRTVQWAEVHAYFFKPGYYPGAERGPLVLLDNHNHVILMATCRFQVTLTEEATAQGNDFLDCAESQLTGKSPDVTLAHLSQRERILLGSEFLVRTPFAETIRWIQLTLYALIGLTVLAGPYWVLSNHLLSTPKNLIGLGVFEGLFILVVVTIPFWEMRRNAQELDRLRAAREARTRTS